MVGTVARRTFLAALVAVMAVAPAAARGDGRLPLDVVHTQRLSARLTDFTMRTPALAGDVHVRVLTPVGFDASGARRYPVLYLFNGCCEDWRSWTDLGAAEKVTAPYPLIVVMPEGGYDGNYTDWFAGGSRGPQRWETFHLDQLIPWVEASLPTARGRAGRVAAGLSMGGFGALGYAARHPDLFSAAASFSGVIDTNASWGSVAVDYESLQGGYLPFGPFGPRATQEVRWRAHNPYDLAVNLRGLPLTLRTGNGLPGGAYGSGQPDAIEDLVHRENLSTHWRLLDLGIGHVWDDYGPGQHEWPYWTADLRRTLPWLMGVLADPPAPPRTVTFTAIEPTYEAYGWRVEMRRAALEFSTLRSATRAGFALSGSGDAVVSTPGHYNRRCTYRVVTSGRAGHATAIQRPDGAGRLRVPILLGPDNTAQQFTAGAVTHVYESRATIRRVRCRKPRGRA
jgi:S-formylglutathione hydrolase FrmB